jgi:hypothetical protein
MGTVEDNALIAAGERIMAKWGQAATYRPGNGEPVSCTVHLDEDLKITPENFDLQAYHPTKTIEALLHEIGQIPKKAHGSTPGDTFEIGSYSYEVKTVLEKDGIFVMVGVDDGNLIE